MKFSLMLLTMSLAFAQQDLESIMRRLNQGGAVDRGFLDGSSRYLNSHRARIGTRDPAAAWRLVDAYRRVGLAYSRYGYHPGALSNYHTALLVLHRLAGAYPADYRYRREMIAVAGLITDLGGVLPGWYTMPSGVHAAPPRTEAAPPPAPVEEFALPKPDTSNMTDAEVKACEAALDQYIGVAASARAALNAVRELRQSVQTQGLSLHGNYATTESNVKLRMEESWQKIQDGRCAESQTSLKTAEAFAKRLSRDLGR